MDKQTKELIEPKILAGTRDFLPEEMARRRKVQETLVSVFTRFGYDEIDTPAIEYAETLLGKYGEEGSKLTYSFKDNGGRDVALRYDQTVPFARVVAANYSILPMPFKRYQISKVWRADKPGKGRYREFTQCDIDVIGTKNLVSEAEVTKVIAEVFKKLGFAEVSIKINSRRLMNSIMNGLDIAEEKQPFVIRILDKLAKIGEVGVREEMKEIISNDAVDRLLAFMIICGTNAEKLAKLKQFNTTEIEQFLTLCRDFNIEENFLVFDPALARGLDYYTGITYEVTIPGVEIGSVCGGGRYDNLCSMFTTEEFSGVGVSFGFDRIVLAMEMAGKLANTQLNSNVLVTYFNEKTIAASLAIADQLQQAGINTEIYFEPAKMDRQFKYADKKRIPFVVICGEDEIRDNTVSIKNMESGKQETVPRDKIVNYFQKNLKPNPAAC